jgi:hypothetical protein
MKEITVPSNQMLQKLQAKLDYTAKRSVEKLNNIALKDSALNTTAYDFTQTQLSDTELAARRLDAKLYQDAGLVPQQEPVPEFDTSGVDIPFDIKNNPDQVESLIQALRSAGQLDGVSGEQYEQHMLDSAGILSERGLPVYSEEAKSNLLQADPDTARLQALQEYTDARQQVPEDRGWLANTALGTAATDDRITAGG